MRRWVLLSAKAVLKHNLAHGFSDMFASIARVQSLFLPLGRD